MSLPTGSSRRAPRDGHPQPCPSARDIVLSLEGVSVQYRTPREHIRSVKEYVIRVLQRQMGHGSFWALRNVGLEVPRGTALGIIGRNGAGKSTLLKVVSRVLRPTCGRVVVKGRVAPLIEFQAGFHAELTGRENIFLNGTLLGFTRRQMEAKLDRIVDFAELWDSIDAPLRTYSSGMVARLGFSIATDERPDVLLVDEVLSVGDEAFRRKSAVRIREYCELGTTVLFVSHNMEALLDICSRAIWLEHGEVAADGVATDVVCAYREDSDRAASSDRRNRTLQRRADRPAFRGRRARA